VKESGLMGNSMIEAYEVEEDEQRWVGNRLKKKFVCYCCCSLRKGELLKSKVMVWSLVMISWYV